MCFCVRSWIDVTLALVCPPLKLDASMFPININIYKLLISNLSVWNIYRITNFGEILIEKAYVYKMFRLAVGIVQFCLWMSHCLSACLIVLINCSSKVPYIFNIWSKKYLSGTCKQYLFEAYPTFLKVFSSDILLYPLMLMLNLSDLKEEVMSNDDVLNLNHEHLIKK